MSAVAAVARGEWRRSYRALLALGAAVGLAAACASGALSLARRTDTAEQRLQRAAHVEDAQVRLLSGTAADQVAAARIARLPEVRSAWVAGAFIGRTAGPGVGYVAVAAGPPRPPGLITPVMATGRPARAADEIEVVDGFARAFGLHPGSVLALALLTPSQAGRFQTGVGTPQGPTVRLRVTGVFRAAEAPQSLAVLGTPAFAARYGADAGARVVFARLRPGGRAGFSAALGAVPGASTVGVTFPADDARPVDATSRVLAGGLLAVAVVLAVGALVAAGQAFARRAGASVHEQRVESALGLTSAQRTLGRTVPALAAAVLAAGVGAGGATAAAVLSPPGAVRPVEPHPGWLPNVALIAATAAVTLLAVAGVAAWAADAAGRPAARAQPRPRPARLPRRAWVLGGRRLGPGNGSSAGRGWAPRAGATLGVAGVISVLVFASSLHRLVATPARWGWNGQFEVVDSRPPVVAQLAADRGVRGVAALESSVVQLDGQEELAYAERDVKGRAGWTVIDGRLPRARGEALVGTALARHLGVGRRGTVSVAEGRGHVVQLRVVGTGVGPVLNNEALGDAVVLSPADLVLAARAAPSSETIVDAPARAQALQQALAPTWELSPRSRPREVSDLAALGRLPEVLALALAATACAAMGHDLWAAARSGGRELLVLRTLGLTGTEVTAAFLVGALVSTALGLALAVPGGVVLGRIVWWAVARSHGVATDVSLPVLLTLGVVCAAAVVCALLGWSGARRVLYRTPLSALRGD